MIKAGASFRRAVASKGALQRANRANAEHGSAWRELLAYDTELASVLLMIRRYRPIPRTPLDRCRCKRALWWVEAVTEGSAVGQTHRVRRVPDAGLEKSAGAPAR